MPIPSSVLQQYAGRIHGKRTDKETQSPMLKIFKDMMQKDKRDPEKTNLLKDRHTERKRKHYAGSRSKSGHKTVSSSSDHPKKEPQYKRSEETRNVGFDACRSQRSAPFQGEKRESWWFWGGDPVVEKTKEEDSCSCVSCALKKLLSTDYACIACITVLFIVSVVVAIMLVYRCVPSTVVKSGRSINRDNKLFYQKPENERLKRKIGGLWSFGPKKEWRNIFSKSSSDGSEFNAFNFQGNDMASLVESENELSKILDSDKLSDIQHSDRLKDFYKKLVQTDAAIRNLRKSLNDNSYVNNNFDINSNNFDFDSSVDLDNDDLDTNIDLTFPDRSKRSIKLYPNRLFHFKRREPATQSKIDNGKLITKSTINMTANKKPNKNQNSRNKRFDNITDGSFVIEKNKVVIQYKPNRKVAKCSHSPKESKPHEAQLSHPFYKNTQRLDELLDQFMDKKIPDFLSDRLEFGVLFDKNKKCKHPSNEEIILVKDDDILKDYDQTQKNEQDQTKDERDEDNRNTNYLTSDFRVETEKISMNKDKTDQTTSPDYGTLKGSTKVAKSVKDTREIYANDFFDDSDGVERKKERSTTPSYDILLSISTPGNSLSKKATVRSSTDYPDRPNMRKLQQINMKEEDGVAYEDLKEVLSDYKDGHDDEDREGNRKKRTLEDLQLKIASMKNYPAGVHNPNWKGAMPLYPEELTQMMKQNEQDNQENKDKNDNPQDYKEVPVHNRDVAAEGDDENPRRTDVEYVEDYLDNGYEKLVELAQAYSDYGVLNEKKDLDAEKKTDNKEHHKANKKRLGLSKRIRNSFKRGMKKNAIIDKLKRGRDTSEGIRIEIHPDKKFDPNNADVDSYKSIKGMLQKHVKVVNDLKNLDHAHETLTPDISTSRESELKVPATTKISKTYPMPDVIYKKRTLKTMHNKFGYDATDKMVNKVFNVDKLQFKRDTNKNIETDKGDNEDTTTENTTNLKFDKKLKLNEYAYEENKDTITVSTVSNSESDKKIQFKRCNDKIKEVDEDTDKIIENASPFLQNKGKFKRDTNNTVQSNIEKINRSLTKTYTDAKQNKRGIFATSSNKQNNNNDKSVNIEVNGKSGSHSKPSGDKTSVKDDDSSLSKFFMVLSNWFSTLDAMEMTPKNTSIVTQRSARAEITNTSNQTAVTESQLTFPLYDSDMIENIGHRSRVLLSIENNTTGKVDEVSSSDDDENVNVLTSTGSLNTSITQPVKDTTDSTKPEDNSNDTDNRIVKRQAIDDSNLIFWNDLYDEEYGINADPLDNNIRDKHSVDRNDFLKKSNTWIQDKVRRIADKLYLGDFGKDTKEKDGTKQVKRSAKYDEDEEDNTVKLDVATLTERMKQVCKETVKAVQETKHIQDVATTNCRQLLRQSTNSKESFMAFLSFVYNSDPNGLQFMYSRAVREENKQGQAASTLMQQLVRLMTDLVDFQVQERTCRRLPPDLQHFLDWLTSNKEDEADADSYYTEKSQDSPRLNSANNDKSTEQDLLQPSERENTDSRTDCLGTLHAVQNLIREYEDMNEDDKSLMTGVKTYLENQMNYLQKQLSSLEDKQYNKSRFKRDIAQVGHNVAQSIDATARTLDKEYKNFRRMYQKYKGKAGSAYKQVLKTTAHIKEAVSDMKKKISYTTSKPKTKVQHTKVLKINDKTKIIDRAKIEMDKQKYNEHTDHKDKKHKHKFFHSKNNNKNKLKSHAKAKDKVSFEDNLEDFENSLKDFKDLNYLRSKNTDEDIESYIDQSFRHGDKDERNIKDVYFKAVEEAKKATLSKGSHIHDGELFDKTDIFRINDYLDEKRQ